MKLWQEYICPNSIPEALQAFSSASGSTCLMAGGTDLMLDLQQGRHAAIHTLVDVTSIPELNQLEIRGGDLFIGSAVVLSRIARSPLVVEHSRSLAEACSLIGGPQVRNVATLGGNVAHALPAADGTIALISLNTRVEVAGLNNSRIVSLQEMFLGPGRTTLGMKEEIITGFYIPLCKDHQASAFKRIMRAQGIALPIINISTWLERKGDQISDLRIAIGPSGPTPCRITAAEDLLRYRIFPKDLDLDALFALLDQVPFRTSPHRATSEYRHLLVKDLLMDTLIEAWKRAG